MAKFCAKCNSKLGMLEMMGDLCGSCKAEDKADREERNNQAIINRTRESIERGNKIFLYKNVFVSVDSTMVEKKGVFNMNQLVREGLSGWEITGLIHRTQNIALVNKTKGVSGSQYGGSATTIDGAYAILKKEVNSNDQVTDNEILEAYR